jgi:hypothetical protein
MRGILGAAITASAAFIAGCAGARYDFGAEHARYPISFSPALPDDKGTILYLGHELESKGSFEFSTYKLGFLYSATSGTIDVSDQINAEVAKRGGEGVVALALRNTNCFTNYLFPLPLLPFYPGCQVVTVTGTVVSAKQSKVAEMSPAAGPNQAGDPR